MFDNKIVYNDDEFEEIAIIGMAGRFPGAENIDQYWANLKNGVESIKRFTDEELNKEGVPEDLFKSPNFVKASAVFPNPFDFDAFFFGYSPHEASSIDPQQRLFLETAWEALENAGYTPESCDGPIGVYAGSSPTHYIHLYNDTDLLSSDVISDIEKAVGNEKDYLATRVSYKFNLLGPSLTIQTACSTSLVAVQVACQSLLDYQCKMAIAGAVTANLINRWGYFFQEGTMNSPEGYCRAFDAAANGSLFGDGVGVVVLKRLSEAVKDHDHIYAIIKGCSLNNDGADKISFVAPRVDGQAEVIAMAQAISGVEAESISYVETHGTGTKLGDPIEIEALNRVFRESTDKKQFCAIGSVKPNIGHSDAAAGIASLIKLSLMLKHKKIVPSLHFKRPNPEIDLENSPFYVATKLTDWDTNNLPRRAGISCFGFGGTNAHAILEELQENQHDNTSKNHYLLVLSAKTETALEKYQENLSNYLKDNSDVDLADIAFTLQFGRKKFNHRRIIVCNSVQDAISIMSDKESEGKWNSKKQNLSLSSVVFMFSGQGSQYVNMGRDLYSHEPVFRKNIDLCSDILKNHSDFDLKKIIYPENKNEEANSKKLKQTAITQPALFAIEYSLTKLWMSWGINPNAMIGHSIGEYVAACISNVFSLEDALLLVSNRGRLMQDMPRGSMIAVSLSNSDIQPLLENGLTISAINAPKMCVISGANDSINRFTKKLEHEAIPYKKLRTSHAFHSNMMDPILQPFVEKAGTIKMNPPKIPFISNVTGDWISSNDAINPKYWAHHLRSTVRFSDGLKKLFDDSRCIMLEVGPGNTLTTLARQQPSAKNNLLLYSIRHPNEKKSDTEFIMSTLGKIWMTEVNIDWEKLYGAKTPYRIPLPTYPFERKRYCISEKSIFSLSQSGGNVIMEPEDISSNSDQTKRIDKMEYNSSQKSMEEVIKEIWQDHLGIDLIETGENFFELGGNSLIAVQIIAKIRDELGIKLSARDMFNSPTIAKMTNFIEDSMNIKGVRRIKKKKKRTLDEAIKLLGDM